MDAINFRTTLLSLLIIASFIIPSSAQISNYVFQHITVSDGLANNYVSALFQDHFGFVWIATNGGLQRFDGYEFETFKHDYKNPHSLGDDFIYGILEDNQGRLWLGYLHSGIGFYDFSTKQFFNFKFLSNDPGNALSSITIDRKTNQVFSLVGNSIVQLDEKDTTFKKIFTSADMDFRSLYADPTGKLWGGTGSGIKYFDPSKQEIFSARNNPNHLSILDSTMGVNGIYIDRENNLWISGFNRVLYRCNLTTGNSSSFRFKNILPGSVNDFCVPNNTIEDKKGRIWISTYEGGLIEFNPEKNSWSQTSVQNWNETGFHADNISRSIIEDQDGMIWVAAEHGINLFNPDRQIISPYVPNPNDVNLRVNQMNSTSFHQTSNGDIYAASWTGGLIRLDSNFRLIKQYLHQSSDPHSLGEPENLVWALGEDADGIIWVGEQAGRLSYFNPKTERFINTRPQEFFSQTIVKICKDKKNNFWFCLNNHGITRWDGEKKLFINYTNFINPHEEKYLRVMDAFEDNHHRMWVATERLGLQLFDLKQEKFVEAFTPDSNDSTSISSEFVTSIAELDENHLALGTLEGLNIFDLQTKKFSHLTASDGLPANFIRALFVDEKKHVWIATVSGICVWNPQTNKIVNFGFEDGIIDNEFEAMEIEKLRNGNLLAGTSTGFIVIHPHLINPSSVPQPVSFTGLKVNDKEVNTDSLVENKSLLHLTYRQNNISIHFSSFQFTELSNIRYQYRLSGNEGAWKNSGQNNYVNYSELQPGNYIFQIRSLNKYGIASPQITSLSIIITPPFWRTWWFTSLVVLLIASLIYFLVRKRIIHIREQDRIKSENQKRMAQLELKALQAQMNPHFIFNSMNSINRYILSNDAESASKYLSRFSRLIRLILENSEESFVTLDKEIELLGIYMDLETNRVKNKFQYHIKIDESLNAGQVKIPAMVIQPHVENAIWHGLQHKQSSGHLNLEFSSVNHKFIRCIIEDDGVGRKKSAEIESNLSSKHKSMGVKITAERMKVWSELNHETVGATITDMNDAAGESIGTRVEILLPAIIMKDN